MNERDKYMTYMVGWRDAASHRPIRAMGGDLLQTVYALGYDHGKARMREAQDYAAKTFNYQPLVIKAMNK